MFKVFLLCLGLHFFVDYTLQAADERSVSNAHDQTRSLQEKIKKLEEENGATEKEAQVQSR